MTSTGHAGSDILRKRGCSNAKSNGTSDSEFTEQGEAKHQSSPPKKSRTKLGRARMTDSPSGRLFHRDSSAGLAPVESLVTRTEEPPSWTLAANDSPRLFKTALSLDSSTQDEIIKAPVKLTKDEVLLPQIVVSPAILVSETPEPGRDGLRRHQIDNRPMGVCDFNTKTAVPLADDAFMRLSKAIFDRQQEDDAWRTTFNSRMGDLFWSLYSTADLSTSKWSRAKMDQCIMPIVDTIKDAFGRGKSQYPASPTLSRLPSRDGDDLLAQEWFHRLYKIECSSVLNIILGRMLDFLSCDALPGCLAEIFAYLCLRLTQVLRSGESSEKPDEQANLAGIRSFFRQRKRGSAAREQVTLRPSAPLAYRRTVSVEYGIPPQDRLQERVNKDGSTAALFVQLLRDKLDDLLLFGQVSTREAGKLNVPPVPRNTMRWKAYLNAAQQARQARHTIKTHALAQCLSASTQDYKQKEQAVQGNVRNAFTSAHVVRFVGELYLRSLVDLDMVEGWNRRMLFHTSFAGTPSLWELECACVLLITIMPRLHEFQFQRQSLPALPLDNDDKPPPKRIPCDGRVITMQRSFSAPHEADPEHGSRESATGSESRDNLDIRHDSTDTSQLSVQGDHSRPHHINSSSGSVNSLGKERSGLSSARSCRRSPLSPVLHKLPAGNTQPTENVELSGERCLENVRAAKLLRLSLSRLRDLQRQPEIHSESKAWIEEVCALSQREASKWTAKVWDSPCDSSPSGYRLSIEAEQYRIAEIRAREERDAAKLLKRAGRVAERRKKNKLRDTTASRSGGGVEEHDSGDDEPEHPGKVVICD